MWYTRGWGGLGSEPLTVRGSVSGPDNICQEPEPKPESEREATESKPKSERKATEPKREATAFTVRRKTARGRSTIIVLYVSHYASVVLCS